MAQNPRRCNRGITDTVFFGQHADFLIQVRVLVASKETSLPCRHLERRPRLKRNIVEPAVVEQTSVVVNRARRLHIDFHAVGNKIGNRNAELYLIDNERLADIFLQERDLHRLVVGNAEIVDLSALKENIKRRGNFFRVHERVRAVEQQKIEVIRLQPF